VRALQGAAEPYSLVFAVAPDIAGIETVIPEMTRQGNPVFMTHTAASVEQTKRAIEAGVRHATHFYNVYPVPEETDPGVRPCGAVETVLADPRVSVDFILDGEHVDPIAVQMALQCKGPDRVCLITDANIGAGLPPGVYTGLGGSEVRFAYEGAPARMTENAPHPGSLAGSGLTLDRAVKNAVSFLSLDIVQAIRMVSLNPAHILNIEDHKGKIEIGYDADLVLLNRELEVQKTWVEGKLCYSQSN
jgi:N-acetylglucosamine-6-phosphate deacetylase